MRDASPVDYDEYFSIFPLELRIILLSSGKKDNFQITEAFCIPASLDFLNVTDFVSSD